MNIVIFSLRGPTNEDVKGGARNYILEFAKVLHSINNGDVTILCGQEKNISLPEIENVEGINIVRIPLSYSILSLHIYYSRYLKNKTDLVIENIVSFPMMTSIYKKNKINIIHHLPGKDYFRSHGVIKGIIGVILEYFLMPIFYKDKRIVTVSKLSKDEIVKRGIKSKSIEIIEPIIDTNQFITSTPINDREDVICYIGRYDGKSGVKRVDHLIEAFKIVVKKYPSVKLSIAGSMKKENELIEQVKKLNLSKNVHIMGSVSEELKKEILQNSKLFASPSYQEGFGITLIEANAAGLPVVGYKLEGLDTVPDNAGVFVPKDDIQKLSNSLIYFLENSKILTEFSENAVMNSKRFNKKIISNKIINLFKECL